LEIAHQDVFDFDVAVHYQPLVQTLEAEADLPEDVLGLVFGQRLPWLLDQVVKKVPGWHELGDDVEVLGVFEGLEHLDNIGTLGLVHLFKEFKLGEGLITCEENFINLRLFHEFDGHLHLRVDVLGKDHRSEGSAPQFTETLVLVDGPFLESLTFEDFLMPLVDGLLVFKVYRALLRR